jgi:hypothetical protein
MQLFLYVCPICAERDGLQGATPQISARPDDSFRCFEHPDEEMLVCELGEAGKPLPPQRLTIRIPLA